MSSRLTWRHLSVAGVALSFALGAILVSSVFSALPAAAHTALINISPADNSRLTTSPTQVVLEFNEQVSPAFATVVVTNAAGVSVTRGKVTVDGTMVTQSLSPGLTSGAYRIAYRVTSADGHPVSAESRFTLALTAHPGPATAPASSTTQAPAVATPPTPRTAAPTTPGRAVQERWRVPYGVVLAGAAGVFVVGVGVLRWERRRH